VWVIENTRAGIACRNWSRSWITFTLIWLPSLAETHGNHTPNVTVPLCSTAPSLPIGSKLKVIDPIPPNGFHLFVPMD
jgi:hypothetical protein